MKTAAPVIKHLDRTSSTPCPCGEAFRMITGEDNGEASIHVVEIRNEAKRHYHKHHTEYYYCLEGTGQIELDAKTYDLAPGTVVMIPPMTVHAARGEFRIINVVVPPFDPEDEYVVD